MEVADYADKSERNSCFFIVSQKYMEIHGQTVLGGTANYTRELFGHMTKSPVCPCASRNLFSNTQKTEFVWYDHCN